jgi:hypothetical protein
VSDERVGQVGAHLHLADTGFGLGVGDVEAGFAAVVEADLADAQVAKLAVAHAAVAKDAHDERPAGIQGADDRHPPGVPAAHTSRLPPRECGLPPYDERAANLGTASMAVEVLRPGRGSAC